MTGRSAAGRRGRARAALTIFLAGVACGAGILWAGRRIAPLGAESDIEHYREVRDFVLETFVRDVDPDELVEQALAGMVDGLDEPSRYYAEENEAARIDRETSGHFVGIGVVFRARGEALQVLFPLPGSPAARAGVRVGDVIRAIEGEPVDPGDLEAVRAALRGEPGSLVHVSLLGRDGVEREVEIRRDTLLDPTVRRAEIVDAQRGVGYLAITSFTRETPSEFDRAIERLREQGARALVIDLRANPGGVLTAAVDVARRFVPEGLIVSTEGRGAIVRHLADPEEARFAGLPLAVLVDSDSASAAEVLAGALQDHRVGVVIGEPTHGKGTVQTIRRFPERHTAAKVTSSYYYTPAHRSLARDPEHGKPYGLQPDLLLETYPEERRAIQRWLLSHAPPTKLLAEIRNWEREEGVTLVEPRPDDPVLAAALALFAGERPEGGAPR